MRTPEPYTLFPRRTPSGGVVYYARGRRPDGRRTTARSTEESDPKAAERWCKAHLVDGLLVLPEKHKAAAPPLQTFSDLALDFWGWDTSEYIRARLRFSDPKKPAISARYCHDMARIVELHLSKPFGRRHLESITPQEIEAFALRLRDDGLSGKRVNNIVTCLRVMLTEAYRAGAIAWDPAKKGAIRALGNAPRPRGRLTLDEVRRLFAPEMIATAWGGHILYRVVNLVAAATGMRQGEVLATRDPDVRPGYIHVAHSYAIGYGLGPTKTRTSRDVPLPPRVAEAVRSFLGSGGYVFSLNGGKSPCTGNRITGALYQALEAIGVTDRAERNITFHSWRHWLNSTLRARAVPDDIVRKVTGHATADMTEAYTEYLAEDFAPVVAVQAEVFG